MNTSTLPSTLRFSEHDRDLRNQIRTWLEDNDVTVSTDDFDERIRALAEWQGKLHAAGFIGLSWPKEVGGRGFGLAAEAVLAEELARSGTPELVNRLALYTLGPTIMEWGTKRQQQEWLPGMLDATDIWCQGFSEPGAGSDLAAISTTGRIEGDQIVVTGQKVWTSRAMWSKWGLVLIRTEAGSKRHRGLSMIAVDMATPGVTIRPLLQVLHEPHFSEVFFDEARVPVDNVLGPLGEGWGVAMSTMGYERGLFALERQIRLTKRLHDLVELLDDRGTLQDHAGQIGEVAAILDVLRAQIYRTLASQAAGTLAPGDTSVDKLLLTEADQRLFSLAYDIQAPELVSSGPEWIHDLLESRAVSIYSGTSEIQHNIIADKLVGMPKGNR